MRVDSCNDPVLEQTAVCALEKGKTPFDHLCVQGKGQNPSHHLCGHWRRDRIHLIICVGIGEGTESISSSVWALEKGQNPSHHLCGQGKGQNPFKPMYMRCRGIDIFVYTGEVR